MKISFIGKGGVGKSTLSCLFSLFLSQLRYKVVLIDADINLHVPKLFNLNFKREKFIAQNENIIQIRKYLTGENKKINFQKMVKTTPPGVGSNFFTLEEKNFILNKFSKKINKNLYLLVVGSYFGEKAGLSCYHSDLSILENILSHSNLKKDEFLIADMVAGIDSLANTLFLQFNLHFFIVEPTKESIEVYLHYLKEIKKTKFKINIIPIFNKIESNNDLNFIKENIKTKKFIIIPKIEKLKLLSQKKIELEDIIKDKNIQKILSEILNKAKEIQINKNEDLKNIQKLHLKYCQLDYVKRAYGDLSYQVDENFSFN